MNNIFRSVSCCLLIFLFSAQAVSFAKAGKNKINNRNEPISVKCHLTFINGHENIIFWRIKADQVATWPKDIVGKKIESSGFKGKVKIYKVFECISTKGTFTSNQAKLLDLNKGGR